MDFTDHVTDEELNEMMDEWEEQERAWAEPQQSGGDKARAVPNPS